MFVLLRAQGRALTSPTSFVLPRKCATSPIAEDGHGATDLLLTVRCAQAKRASSPIACYASARAEGRQWSKSFYVA